jgi:hypothetical protein
MEKKSDEWNALKASRTETGKMGLMEDNCK